MYRLPEEVSLLERCPRVLCTGEKSLSHCFLFVVVSHEQVEGGTCPRAYLLHARTTVSQQAATELGTLLRLLVKQEVGKLPDDRSLCTEYIFHDLDTLVSPHQMQKNFQSLYRGRRRKRVMIRVRKSLHYV